MKRRVLPWLGLVSVLLAGASARGMDEPWIHGIYTGESPRPVQAPAPEAWQQAGRIAAHNPGSFVLVGTGRSMQPLYAPGTILVLQPLPFNQLKRGQTVIYRSRESKVVAHVLVAKARDGWRAQGLNNRTHDMEPVRSGNLVGVVVAAFQPATRSRSVALASLRLPVTRAVN